MAIEVFRNFNFSLKDQILVSSTSIVHYLLELTDFVHFQENVYQAPKSQNYHHLSAGYSYSSKCCFMRNVLPLSALDLRLIVDLKKMLDSL